MNTSKGPFVVIGVLVVFLLVLLGWQRRVASQLQAEIAHQRERTAVARTRLRDENQRLVASHVSGEEVERLRAERAALERLRAEIASMRRRAEATAVAVKTTLAAPVSSAPRVASAPSMRETSVPAALWRNAGQGNPGAAFETALWAAAGGDVEELARLLAFDADARQKAEAIFAQLPSGMQQELVSADRLIALLVAKDVPLGSARIFSETTTTDEGKLSALLLDETGSSKRVQLALRAEAGNWRFVVPVRAVERYASLLQPPVVGR